MNPQKMPIPDFERKLEHMRYLKKRLEKAIGELEVEIARRRALPD